MIPSRRRLRRLRPRVLPFDPISELTKGRAGLKKATLHVPFVESPDQAGGGEGSRRCLFAETTRLRSTSEPATREEAYFARGLLAEEDRRSHARGATVSRRDACLSRKRAGKKAAARESLSGGDVAAAELNSCATGVELLGAGTSVFLCKPVMVCHKIARREESRRIIVGRSP